MVYSWLRAPASQIAVTARTLLGWTVSANGVGIRLTEVEAYSGTGDDPASHAHRGRTRRTEVLFGAAGRVYMYLAYGMHWCMNIACGHEGEAAGVLLRSGTVIHGLPIARRRRHGARERDLARGPGRLVQALGVTPDAIGTSAVDGSGPVHLTPPEAPVDPASIVSGPRVGVTSAHDVPWRFWLSGEVSVSAHRRPARRS